MVTIILFFEVNLNLLTGDLHVPSEVQNENQLSIPLVCSIFHLYEFNSLCLNFFLFKATRRYDI